MSLHRFHHIFSKNILQLSTFHPLARSLSTTSTLALKQIQVDQKQGTLHISGEYVDSDRKPHLIQQLDATAATPANKKFCPKCTLGLDIKHTDVLILSQYVRSDGCMLPQRVTGLCLPQQKRIGKLVTMAQKAGLMPNLAPEGSHRDPTKRYEWKKFNKYYDEKTIKLSNRIIE